MTPYELKARFAEAGVDVRTWLDDETWRWWASADGNEFEALTELEVLELAWAAHVESRIDELRRDMNGWRDD